MECRFIMSDPVTGTRQLLPSLKRQSYNFGILILPLAELVSQPSYTQKTNIEYDLINLKEDYRFGYIKK